MNWTAQYQGRGLVLPLLIISSIAVIAKVAFEFGTFILLRYFLVTIYSEKALTHGLLDILGTVIGLMGYLPILIVYAVCGCFVSAKLNRKYILVSHTFIWIFAISSIYFIAPYVFLDLVLDPGMYSFVNALYYVIPLLGLAAGSKLCAKSRSIVPTENHNEEDE